MENEAESAYIGITCMSARWQVCENTGRGKEFVISLHIPVVENDCVPRTWENARPNYKFCVVLRKERYWGIAQRECGVPGCFEISGGWVRGTLAPRTGGVM